MSKKVKQVRRAIEERKKKREHPMPEGKEREFVFHDTEEKHGYPPEIAGYTFKRKEGKSILTALMFKGILAGILFFTVAILMQTDHDRLSQSREVASQWLQNEFPFAKVNLWYQGVFGSPLAFSPQTDFKPDAKVEATLPVTGQITETFQINGTGVKITPDSEVDVFSHQAGVVIFAGRDGDTEKTIKIQHADGTDTSYGYLSEIDVHHYQFVSANQRIGRFIPEDGKDAVYFSIEKDNDYLDPIEVVEVDDAS